MPIKWTPETDQTLLLKLFETSGVVPDYKAIVEAWPADQPAPTPRAVSERIIKIRQMAAKSAGGQPTTPKSSPRKGKTNISPANGSATKGENGVKKSRATKVKKSKSLVKIESSDDEEDVGPVSPTVNTASDDDYVVPTPIKIKNEVPVKAESPAIIAEDYPLVFAATENDTYEEEEAMGLEGLYDF